MDSRLSPAAELFHAREFFACHDLLEELWSETLDDNRDFLQGLIHAAVALHHFGEGNFGGARKMHDSTLRYLAPYGDQHWGLDLKQFRQEFSTCFQPLLGARSDYPADAQLRDDLIPHWHTAQP